MTTTARRPALYVALGLLVVALVVVATYLALADREDPKPAPAAASATAPATRAVSGTLALTDPDGFTFSADTGCRGSGGYDDIRPGAQVVITDSAGATVALGELGTGRLGGNRPGDTDQCKLMFAVSNVPTGHDFYGVEVAHRGRVQYPEAQLFGALALTLG